MSRWSWQGAVVALVAGDKYFARVRDDSSGVEYSVGDCVRLLNERKRELLAVLTAMWEARDGTRHIECRQFFHELALVRQLQESSAPVPYPPTAKELRIAKLWESNHFETVPLEWIDCKLQIMDTADCNESTAMGADFVTVGFFNERADRLEHLPTDSTRLERSQQLSARARAATSTDTEPEQASVGSKRPRTDSTVQVKISPEAHTAIAKLHTVCEELLLSHAPEQTTAREDERDLIHDQLQTAIMSGASNGALYISGLPGTGKTSIVREVIRQLEMESKHGVIPAFAWIEINGLHLPKPEVAYASIWKVVMGVDDVPRSLGPAKLCHMLASEFENGKAATRPTLLLVLDEMDFLVTGKSVVLYNILEWQAFHNSKLVVVGIANTMDLPERLEQKVRSRLGSNRLIFSSYMAQQLESIVRQRLQKVDIFSTDAIQISCKFVAQASGDARQALTLCRRAAEVTIERLQRGHAVANQMVVTAEDMQAAQSATSVSGPLIRLRDCRKFECVFLVALRMEIKRTDSDAAAFESVLTRFAVLCTTHSLTPVPRLRDLLLICDELSRSGILRQTRTKSSRYPKLMLRCSPQEIYDVFLAHPIGRQLLT